MRHHCFLLGYDSAARQVLQIERQVCTALEYAQVELPLVAEPDGPRGVVRHDAAAVRMHEHVVVVAVLRHPSESLLEMLRQDIHRPLRGQEGTRRTIAVSQHAHLLVVCERLAVWSEVVLELLHVSLSKSMRRLDGLLVLTPIVDMDVPRADWRRCWIVAARLVIHC